MKALFFIVLALFAALAVAGFFLSAYGRLVRKQPPAKKSRVTLTEQ